MAQVKTGLPPCSILQTRTSVDNQTVQLEIFVPFIHANKIKTKRNESIIQQWGI